MSQIAIIGGSGVYNLSSAKVVEEQEIETPFGKPSSKIKKIDLSGDQFYFLPRHGEGHYINPSDVNYRANLYALKSLGVKYILSISAVGSLKEEYAPNDFVLVDQFIDWTKGKRARSFFEDGVVGHVSVAYPVEKALQQRMAEVLKDVDVKTHVNGTYICIEGPQFSSRAESELYRSFGCDVIGMTNVPESYLAKEAGMAYATVAMVTDYDCWKEEHCTLEEIMKVMAKNYDAAQAFVSKIIPSLTKDPVSFTPENEFAVVTKPELISAKNKEIIEVLTRK